MKKALSLILAISMLLAMTTGFGSSAAVANLLPIDEEHTDVIHQNAYMGNYGNAEGQIPLPAIGSWINGGEKIEGGWFPSEYMNFDTETVKFGTKSIRIKLVDKTMPHECATVYMPSELLEAGKTYTFQSYFKSQKIIGSGGVTLAVGALDYSHTAVPGWTDIGGEYVTGTKDWSLMSITFTMPESNKGYILSFSCQVWGVMSGTAWFDGLALVEGDKSVDYESLAPIEAPSTEPTPVAPTLNGEPSAWAKEEIIKALEADLVPDHVNSAYTTDITRSDFCDLIAQLILKKTGMPDMSVVYSDLVINIANKNLAELAFNPKASFPDTDNLNVKVAAQLGIVNGRTNGNFDPNANITRQEAAKMLALAAKIIAASEAVNKISDTPTAQEIADWESKFVNDGFLQVDDVAFADGETIYAWAKPFVSYVNTIGVMNGTSTTTPPNFSPLRTYTREQSILTVYRLFNAL